MHAEQQRTPQRLLPLRKVSYQCDIYQQWAQQYPDKPLPLIYSIVVYNGDRPYPYSTELLDLFAEPEAARVQWVHPLRLIDLPQLQDKELPQTVWAHALLGLMKHVHDPNLAEFIKQSLRGDIAQLESTHGHDFVISIPVLPQFAHFERGYFCSQAQTTKGLLST